MQSPRLNVDVQLVGAAAAQLQLIVSGSRGGMERLSGSAGLCVCRPCSACYFLEVISPTLPHQGKALMISGSYEICTACRSRLPHITEPRFRFLGPSLHTTVPSCYLCLSPPHPPPLLNRSLPLSRSHLLRNLPDCQAPIAPISPPPHHLLVALSHYPFLILFYHRNQFILRGLQRFVSDRNEVEEKKKGLK